MLRLLIFFEFLGPALFFSSLTFYVFFPDAWVAALTSAGFGFLITAVSQVIGWRTMRNMSPGLQRLGLLVLQVVALIVGLTIGIFCFYLLLQF